MLAYFSIPQAPHNNKEAHDTWPIGLTTHCAHSGCSRTWRDYDACLLNFAPRDELPIWLCRDHHPPLSDGGIRPAGYQIDGATRESIEESRRVALAKLSREELRIVNTRIGG